MRSITRFLVNFLKREEGVTVVECALMLALVVVICIVAANTVESTPQVDDSVALEAPQK
jgi:pilus assembly protein Flp/PilA